MNELKKCFLIALLLFCGLPINLQAYEVEELEFKPTRKWPQVVAELGIGIFSPGSSKDPERARIVGDESKNHSPEPSTGPLGSFKLAIMPVDYLGLQFDLNLFGCQISSSVGGGTALGGNLIFKPLALYSLREFPEELDFFASIGGGYTAISDDYGYEGSYLKVALGPQYVISDRFSIGINFAWMISKYQQKRILDYGTNEIEELGENQVPEPVDFMPSIDFGLRFP